MLGKKMVEEMCISLSLVNDVRRKKMIRNVQNPSFFVSTPQPLRTW